MPGPSTTLLRTASLALALLAASAPGLSGQGDARVRIEENFRREPNGVVLARLVPDAPLRVTGNRDNWLQVDVEGWVWLASLRTSDTEYDLAVASSGGENLRAGPSGAIIGRLEEGALLEEVGREPGWAHVRRRGWIWSASVVQTGAASTAPAASATEPARATGPAARRPDGFTRVGAAGAPILTAPDGDTLAVASPRSDLEVVARDGSWARVRLDGWVWMPEGAGAAETGPTATAALVPQDLAREPGAHVGRVVAWALQFISLERAEAIRTEFRQGEPFLLTRFGGPDGPFVYVAVPPERLTEMEGLVPLERISVTARIRTGASSLTGTPIVDLLSLERAR